MSLRTEYGLGEPGVEQEPRPGILQLCWDPLFNFLRGFFKPLRPRRPVVILENLEAETTTNYKELLSWKIPSEYEGIINEISLYASNGDKGIFFVQVADQELFKDQKILPGILTLPWKELPLNSTAKVIIQVKTSDGTATDFGACLTGELRYLGGR